MRQKEQSLRSFGQAPTAAWTAFRAVIPWQQDPSTRPDVPPETLAYSFLQANPASTYEDAPVSAAAATPRTVRTRTLRYAHRAQATRRSLVSQAHSTDAPTRKR